MVLYFVSPRFHKCNFDDTKINILILIFFLLSIPGEIQWIREIFQEKGLKHKDTNEESLKNQVKLGNC